MPTLHADNIGEVCAAANGGTGTLTLSGTAITAQNCRTFARSVSDARAGDLTDGATVTIDIREVNADGTYNGVWENCKSVYTVSGNIVSRGELLSSSTGLRITFSTTLIKHVFVGVSGDFMNTLKDTSGTNTGNETAATIGALIDGATAKATPVDADMVGLMDSAAANILKKLSWANIKATFIATANTWSGIQSFNDGKLSVKGLTSGNVLIKAPAVAGTDTSVYVQNTKHNAIPVFLQSSGSIGNNGALTAITALPVTYPSIYLYFPVNAIAAGVAAGLYYCVMSSTTAGTIYNNVYDPSLGVLPTIPSSPTAFSTTGPGAYTQTTAADITLVGVTIPGGSMGASGVLDIISSWESATNNANAKTTKVKIGATLIGLTPALASTITVRSHHLFSNRGSQSVNFYGASSSIHGAFINSGSTLVTTPSAINMATDQILYFTMQLATATDGAGLNMMSVKINYGA